MPLVLSFKEDDEFYVGDKVFFVTEIAGPARFVIEDEFGRRWDVTDERAVEIAPDVMASVGKNGSNHLARLVIDAPRSVPILRGELYGSARPE